MTRAYWAPRFSGRTIQRIENILDMIAAARNINGQEAAFRFERLVRALLILRETVEEELGNGDWAPWFDPYFV